MNSLLCRIGLVAAVVIAPALTAFEGTVTYALKTGSEESTMSYAMRGTAVRVDVAGEGQEAGAMILDVPARQLTLLMESERMYMVMPLPEARPGIAGPDDAEGRLAKTGRTREILGYACEEYTVEENGEVTSLWVTADLGTFFGMQSPLGGERSAWELAMDGKPFFPLLIETKDRRGRVTMTMTATGVSTDRPDEARFRPPAGFQRMDLPMLGRP